MKRGLLPRLSTINFIVADKANISKIPPTNQIHQSAIVNHPAARIPISPKKNIQKTKIDHGINRKLISKH